MSTHSLRAHLPSRQKPKCKPSRYVKLVNACLVAFLVKTDVIANPFNHWYPTMFFCSTSHANVFGIVIHFPWQTKCRRSTFSNIIRVNPAHSTNKAGTQLHVNIMSTVVITVQLPTGTGLPPGHQSNWLPLVLKNRHTLIYTTLAWPPKVMLTT